MIYPGTDLKYKVTVTKKGDHAPIIAPMTLTVRDRFGQAVFYYDDDELPLDSDGARFFFMPTVPRGVYFAFLAIYLPDADFPDGNQQVTDVQLLAHVGPHQSYTSQRQCSNDTFVVTYERVTVADVINAGTVHSSLPKDMTNNEFELWKELLNKNAGIIVENDGLYQVKDNAVYPVSHPDLSTQPSVLPQRFGNLDIKEVLIAHGRESEIPRNATIISAFSFNKDRCAAAFCQRGKVRLKQMRQRPAHRLTPVGFSYPVLNSYLTNYSICSNFDLTFEGALLYLRMKIEREIVLTPEGTNEGYLRFPGLLNVHFLGNRNLSFSKETLDYGSMKVYDIYYDDGVMETLEGEYGEYDDYSEDWLITNSEGFTPDFTLVRYVGNDNGYYYSSGYDSGYDSGKKRVPHQLVPVNFEFPATIAELNGKRMKANFEPLNYECLKNGKLVFHISNGTDAQIIEDYDGLGIRMENYTFGHVEIDGNYLVFTSMHGDNLSITGFGFNDGEYVEVQEQQRV